MIAKLLAIHDTKAAESTINKSFCNKCDSITETSDKLENHNRTQHVIKAIQCPMCNYSNKSEVVINKHIADHHPESKAIQ